VYEDTTEHVPVDTKCVAVCCSKVCQCVAVVTVCCSVMKIPQNMFRLYYRTCSVHAKCVAVCCGKVCQCVAVVTVSCSVNEDTTEHVLCMASVLQCVATKFVNVLQLLQCVAVCI